MKKLTWSPFRRRGYGRPIAISNALELFIDHPEAVKVLANKKLKPFENYSLVHRYENNPQIFTKAETNEAALKWLLPDLDIYTNNRSTLIENLKECGIDVNTLKANEELINLITKDVFIMYLEKTQFKTIIKDYQCDLKTFLTYLYYTLFNRNGLSLRSQGYYSVHEGDFKLSDYVDYLRMQFEMYGKIKEKYPVYWLSEKQMTVNKYNNWKKLRQLQSRLILSETLNNMEYANDVYTIIKPKETSDIVDEGEQLQHCVASYIKRVENGDTNIVFMRYVTSPEDSLITLEIRENKEEELELVQARGMQNRNLNKAEFYFLEKWGKEKNIKIGVTNVDED